MAESATAAAAAADFVMAAVAAAEPAHRHILDLPEDALSSVLCACDLTALVAARATSTALKRIASTAAPWLALLFRKYDLLLPATTPYMVALISIMRIFTEPPHPLLCHGYLTDGGVDDEQEDPSEDILRSSAPDAPRPFTIRRLGDHSRGFWVENAFRDEVGEYYCSKSGARNAIIAAAVKNVLPYADDHRDAIRERRDYVIERLELVIQAMGWDVEGFGGLGTINNDSLMSTLEMAWQAPHGRQMIQATVPPRERTATATRIQEILEEWHSDRRAGPDPVLSFSHGPHALMIGVPYDRMGDREICDFDGFPDAFERQPWGSNDMVAVVWGVTVRRGIQCSCPLQVGVVFACREEPTVAELCGPSVAAFNDICTLEQLSVAAESGAVPPFRIVDEDPSNEEARIVEFDRPPAGYRGPSPVLWFRFGDQDSVGDDEQGLFEVTLRQPRSLRHVAVKLTAPEDRMQEMHDDHDECNIDVDLVELRGWIVPEVDFAKHGLRVEHA